MPIEARPFTYPLMETKSGYTEQIAQGINRLLGDVKYLGHIAIGHPADDNEKLGIILFVDTDK